MNYPVRFVAATALLAAFFLAGCAAKPEDIAPAYVSHMIYEPYTIDQLRAEEQRLQAALATASDAQRKARSNDTAGVILLGLPVSSLSGSNQAANIARLKGELEAVQKTIGLKSGAPIATPAANTATQMGAAPAK